MILTIFDFVAHEHIHGGRGRIFMRESSPIRLRAASHPTAPDTLLQPPVPYAIIIIIIISIMGHFYRVRKRSLFLVLPYTNFRPSGLESTVQN